jgi:hypothetical protein
MERPSEADSKSLKDFMQKGYLLASAAEAMRQNGPPQNILRWTVLSFEKK